MPPRSRKLASFVERHSLWSDAQAQAVAQVERAIKKEKLEVVRFSFADQHGVLRGKTLLASEAASAMQAGRPRHQRAALVCGSRHCCRFVAEPIPPRKPNSPEDRAA